MALESYRQKRRFDKTPEPAGAAPAGSTPGGAAVDTVDAAAAAVPSAAGERRLLYVIQKHAATRLHYDFRLELDGVLLSWAVPKGPSLDPKDKHLAARVEDHPLEYGSFEGTIPKGEYGGGTVMLWDRGHWEPEGDPHEGLRRGDLKFTLRGEKLRGSWVLVRMKPRAGEEGKENWLLIKHRDDEAAPADGQAVLALDRSVASGRTMDEITAAGESSVWHGDRPPDQQSEARPGEEFVLDPSTLPGARAVTAMPGFVKPQLATLVSEVPLGEGWRHEVKFDGYRIVARIEEGRVRMYSRNEKDWTGRYGVLADELAALPVQSAMLDGEVVVQTPAGRTDFQALQNASGFRRRGAAAEERAGADSRGAAAGRVGDPEGGGRLLYYVFDLLYLDGHELLTAPLDERRELLRRLVARLPEGGRIVFSEHMTGQGPALAEEACRQGLEGVVSKKSGSPYRPGERGGDWLKTKCRQEQEFVVGGFTDPGGTRVGFGALLLGVWEGSRLRYVGKVGTGFDERLLRELDGRLRDMESERSPFDLQAERAPKGAHWVRPELVAQVAFSEWTRDAGLRHPSFKGLRADKSPEEIVVEEAVSPESLATAAEGDPTGAGPGADGPGRARRTPRARKPADPAETMRGVTLTHPGKVLWPQDGVTKRGLAEHYERVAPWMLPHVSGRPIAMVRCPEGVRELPAAVRQGRSRSGPCFFHKHPGDDFPGPFERVTIEESAGPDTYLTITEPGSLVALAQMGVLEIHLWGSTWPDIEHPDMLVFDLDPDPAVEWPALADGARLMRDVLKALGLESFVKTTGGKGLHVQAPITPSEDWETVRTFCRAVAEAFVAHAPDRYTANMSKAKRTDKIYVDYVRNNRGATSIAPYSTRARDHATVAVPLRWSELSGSIRPDTYTVETIQNRLSRLKSDPWEGWAEVKQKQSLSEAMRRAVGALS